MWISRIVKYVVIYTIVFIAVPFIQSCSSDTLLYKMPKFKSTGTGEFEVISDDLYFRNAVDLLIYESYAVVVGYNEAF